MVHVLTCTFWSQVLTLLSGSRADLYFLVVHVLTCNFWCFTCGLVVSGPRADLYFPVNVLFGLHRTILHVFSAIINNTSGGVYRIEHVPELCGCWLPNSPPLPHPKYFPPYREFRTPVSEFHLVLVAAISGTLPPPPPRDGFFSELQYIAGSL